MYHKIKPGSRFGSLAVLRTDLARSSAERHYYLCRCRCGRTKSVYRSNLLSGTTNSCGCEKNARNGIAHTKHGYSSWPEYGVWVKMLRRCNNPEDDSYPRYGGRGITVCAEWAGSFEAFIRDMGRRPSPGYSLERGKNDGPYDATNCTWATAEVQARNRRSTRLYTYEGETLCLKDWAERYGLKRETLAYRLNAGYGIAEALSQSDWRI